MISKKAALSFLNQSRVFNLKKMAVGNREEVFMYLAMSILHSIDKQPANADTVFDKVKTLSDKSLQRVTKKYTTATLELLEELEYCVSTDRERMFLQIATSKYHQLNGDMSLSNSHLEQAAKTASSIRDGRSIALILLERYIMAFENDNYQELRTITNKMRKFKSQMFYKEHTSKVITETYDKLPRHVEDLTQKFKGDTYYTTSRFLANKLVNMGFEIVDRGTDVMTGKPMVYFKNTSELRSVLQSHFEEKAARNIEL